MTRAIAVTQNVPLMNPARPKWPAVGCHSELNRMSARRATSKSGDERRYSPKTMNMAMPTTSKQSRNMNCLAMRSVRIRNGVRSALSGFFDRSLAAITISFMLSSTPTESPSRLPHEEKYPNKSGGITVILDPIYLIPDSTFSRSFFGRARLVATHSAMTVPSSESANSINAFAIPEGAPFTKK